MPIEIEGDATTARVMVDDESLVEDNALEQVRTLADHPAFTEPIRVMPDTHWGAGAPVGFTMPLPDAVVPNVVGVDVGCGMAATNLGSELPLDDATRERRVREAVPMGRAVHDYDDAVHLVDEFPFERANEAFEQFAARYRDRFDREIDPVGFDFDGYDGEYFQSLCDRVLAGRSSGTSHVIQSAGTLGGGNHFLEFARGRESGDHWLVVHSGSRYLGLAVAEYWQERATRYRRADEIRESVPEEYERFLKFDLETVSDGDLFEWVTGGKGESHIRKERLRTELDGRAIERAFETLGSLAPTGDDADDTDGDDADDTDGDDADDTDGDDADDTDGNDADGTDGDDADDTDGNDADGTDGDDADDTDGDDADDTDAFGDDLAALYGREAHGYYVDMLFAQQYARWNRSLISEAVCTVLGVEPVESFQSVHNYVDFADLTIRKGATPAREGQRLVIPFDMSEGSVIARGRGNEAYNETAPHGAGRRMGRREAHETLSVDEFETAMEGVYSESVGDETLDEAPMAYKPAAAIRAALTPTAEVVERLDPVHNLKATE
ncbi:RtcB family protein [Halobaculum sp. MBLA0143]|uniref:RtcB family protein n=1 Tax=Halobaculum sp. MBLA0143 TaxID=3079933 RepID=UPI0035252CD8